MQLKIKKKKLRTSADVQSDVCSFAVQFIGAARNNWTGSCQCEHCDCVFSYNPTALQGPGHWSMMHSHCTWGVLLWVALMSWVSPPVYLTTCQLVHLSTCPSVFLSTCPAVHLSTFPPAYLTTCLQSTCPPVHMSTCPPVLSDHLSTCLPVHQSTSPLVHLYTCLSVHLSTCLPVHQSTCTPVSVHLSTCTPVFVLSFCHFLFLITLSLLSVPWVCLWTCKVVCATCWRLSIIIFQLII